MLFTTQMLPKSAKRCDLNDPETAKRGTSLNLTGYFAEMTLYLSHTFNICPSCTEGDYLTTIDIILEDRTIVVSLRADFCKRVKSKTSQTKSCHIFKNGKKIEQGQTVRSGIDEFDAESFLGLHC